MRVLLLRPPRYVWPFNSETSAFWQPLGLLCLAAAVRKHLPQAQVEVWDCPGEKTGWRSLQERLSQRRIDVLGIGEETVSAHEAIRAAAMVKDLWPDCLVVAGGVYFAHAIASTLGVGQAPTAITAPKGLVDVIVRGEGESTFVELLRHKDDRPAWGQIPGLAFLDGRGELCLTRPRELIADLDSLPLPAYDLIDMRSYGRGSRNHPGLVSIEHSRGCFDSCSFCILWKHMGRSADGNGQVVPAWRTKSPQRSFEEVRWLYHTFGRRTFGWVDPTFNASAEWSDQWAERILCSDMMDARGRPRTLHTAWIRSDCAVRDEKLGVLDKLVRAGLRQVMIGVERDDASGLAALGKHNNSAEITRQALAIFRDKHPQVYTIGTMIFGLPGDQREDLERLMGCQYEMGMDYCFIMPLTPNPGTAVAQQAADGGYLANGDLASYNFHTPVCRTDSLTLRQLESVYWRLAVRPSAARAAVLFSQLFHQRDRRKRRLNLSLLLHGTSIAAKCLVRAIRRPGGQQPTLYSRKPSWYDK